MSIVRTTIGIPIILLIVACAAYAGPANDKPSTQPIPDPAKWVAFTSDFGGYTSIEMSFVNKAPHVVVYEDATIVWADPTKLYAGMKDDPAAWHIGKITPADLAKLRASATALKFYTIKPTPPPAAVPGQVQMMTVVSDAATTSVGFKTADGQRIISIYALGMNNGNQSGTDDYSKAVASLRDQLAAMKPANSTIYTPQTIVVACYPAYGKIDTVGVWPLATEPPVDPAANTKSYSGSDAVAIINALASNAYITVADKTYHVVWTPAIAMPTLPVPQERAGTSAPPPPF